MAFRRLESSKVNEPQLATRKDCNAGVDAPHARTYALYGELEEEERRDIERLVFCQLIYSYELPVRRNIFLSAIKDQNKRRTRCAHS